jgi:nucleoside-diphosphate-sugar epimerase
LTFTILGQGFIGSHLLASLRAQGYDCFAPARAELDQLRGRPLGHVLYCIGVTADFRSRPLDTVRAHVCRLAEILDSTQFDSLLYLSSTRVYGSVSEGRETEDAFRVDPASSSDLYDLSKLMGESLCLSLDRPGVRVARLSNVYGPDWTSDNFLSSVIRSAVDHGSVVFRSAPGSAKDYIAVEDAVRVLTGIAIRGRERIYNVASGVPVTHAQLAGKLQGWGSDVTFEESAPRVTFPVIDTTRVREEFAFTPRSVLDDLPGLLTQYRQWSANDSHRS